jgi:PiT family inorganic phosphate transporter
MDIYIIVAVILISLLSFSNGANDVSKAVATLAGAKITSMRNAVMWGTLWTLVGSMSGLYLGAAIIKNISESIYTSQPVFSLAMALAIALTPSLWVILATWKKWPVSTTHAVVGGLLGSGIAALGISGISWGNTLLKLGLPLLLSPFLAIGLAYTLTPILQKVAISIERVRLCLLPIPKFAFVGFNKNTIQLDQNCIVCDCDSSQAQLNHNISVSVDHMHWLTSGVLAFSRGLNDTPKLIAVILPFILVGGVAIQMQMMFWISAISMGLGGILIGSRITKVLGFKITQLDHTQGFSANLISAFIVLFASKLGAPVSTTHVSSCSIMGIGLSGGKGLQKDTLNTMLYAWLITVPATVVIASVIYLIAKML